MKFGARLFALLLTIWRAVAFAPAKLVKQVALARTASSTAVRSIIMNAVSCSNPAHGAGCECCAPKKRCCANPACTGCAGTPCCDDPSCTGCTGAKAPCCSNPDCTGC